MDMNTFIPLKEWKWSSHQELGYSCDWSNCGGAHLLVRLPTGRWWDTGMRARNCSQPRDKEHRCWNVWGEAPFFTINQNGNSCGGGSGAGSILVRNPPWHGFLIRGNWHEDGWPPEAGLKW